MKKLVSIKQVRKLSCLLFDSGNGQIGGSVGIGTAPRSTYQLAVKGKIISQEIKVEHANWPDYVFFEDYKLTPLDELEIYIKDKRHLPGIPTALEVKTHGIELGEMNAKLLQKIEKFTLHLIEMRKKIEDQQKTIEKQNLLFQTAIKDLQCKIRKK